MPAPLKDQYDEWLARVICYAFSVPASAFVSQVNRATSETLRTQAAQEGLVPLKAWVKMTLDRVVQICLQQPDLEFAWVGDDAVDPLQQAQTIAILVNAGIKTRDEARAELGLVGEKGAAKHNHNHDERGRFTTADNVGGPPTGTQVAENEHGPTMTDAGSGRAREQVAQGGVIVRPMGLPPPEPVKPIEVAPTMPEIASPAAPELNTTLNSEAPLSPESSVAELVSPGGKLPGTLTNQSGRVRDMPASVDPNAAALKFVDSVRSGRTPVSVSPIPNKPGAFVEMMSSDTYITCRPAGAASARTSSDTATVQINDPKINALNGGLVLELKFPRK